MTLIISRDIIDNIKHYENMRVVGKVYMMTSYQLLMTFDQLESSTATPMEEVCRQKGGLC